jgi:predicted aspartyl protease
MNTLLRALCGLQVLAFFVPATGPFASENKAATVPFKLVHGYLIEFQGSVAGADGVRFLLDTGATHTIVDQKLAQRLGVALHSKSLFDFDHAVNASEAVFSQLTTGPLHFDRVSLLVGDLSAYSALASGVDAIIGSDLLSQTALIIDYDEKTLSFSMPVAEIKNSPPTQTGMILQLQVQDHPVTLLIDTGAEGIILFVNRVRAKIPHLITQSEIRNVSVGRDATARRALIPGMYLGPKPIDTPAYLVKGPPKNVLPDVDGYLGLSALHPHRVEFNIAANSFRWR